MLRLLSTCFAGGAPLRPAHGDDAKLPIYTVICALYHEAAMVDDLVAAIREKLDVKLVIEADDQETRGALLRLNSVRRLRS